MYRKVTEGYLAQGRGRWAFLAVTIILTTILLALVVTLGPAIFSDSPREVPMALQETARVNAPDFPTGLQWLNTAHPLSLRQLRGKVVLLDFWTYCCINCMHIIPDLKRLEAKYPDTLVVIGVHSAKFAAEQQTDNIRQAILRYDVEHPVVNDNRMQIWNEYAVRAWPTVVLIDPTGKIAGRHSGEGVFAPLDAAIARLVDEFGRRGELDRTPLKTVLEKSKVPNGLLSFPGKVLADRSTHRLFIADSGHNRVVVAGLDDMAVQAVIGSGRVGLTDGGYDEAAFHNPQGMAVDGNILYVADTDNHAIRRVDLAARRVTTLAGNGTQAGWGATGGKGRDAELSSPWALALAGRELYIAMAGTHQIWRLDPDTGDVEVYAGSGREARIDGTLAEAAFAQPSGLASDGHSLYVADSESSSVRRVDLPPGNRVTSLIARDLFDFGDRDGSWDQAKLQHPLGIALGGGDIFLADTYNNKIKRLDPVTRTIKTLAGGDGSLDEPGGLSVVDGQIFIADTNHHCIRRMAATGGTPSVVTLGDMTRLAVPAATEASPPAKTLPRQDVRAGLSRLRLTVDFPPGYEINTAAPSTLTLRFDNSNVVAIINGDAYENQAVVRLPVEVPLRFAPGEAMVEVHLSLYYCREGEQGLCFFRDVRLKVPVRVSADSGEEELNIRYSVSPSAQK